MHTYTGVNFIYKLILLYIYAIVVNIIYIYVCVCVCKQSFTLRRQILET